MAFAKDLPVNNSGKSILQQHESEEKRGERLLPNVLEKFAAEDPDYVLGMNAVYDDSAPTPVTFTKVTVSQIDNGVNYMAYWFKPVIAENNVAPGETITFYGLQDFRYLILEIACMKIGHPLLIARPVNALVNTVNLMKTTNSRLLFFSGKYGSQQQDYERLLPGTKMIEIPSMEEMTRSPTKKYPYTKTWEEANRETVLIIHTSGSTGNPKPIPLNHLYLRRVDKECDLPPVEGRMCATIDIIMPGTSVYIGTNFYHLSGLGFVFCALFRRYTIVFGPVDQLPTGKIAFDMIRSMKFNGLLMVPSLLDWVFADHGEELKEHLGSLEHVHWLGAPLGQATGDWVINNLPNVILWQIYGSTEAFVQPLLISARSHWNHIEFHPTVGPSLEPIDEEEGLYEVVIRHHPNSDLDWTRPVFDIFPNHTEWRMGDVLRRCRDPGFENCYKFEGRMDDIITLSTSGKVNPLHIEAAFQTHPLLRACLVFGEGREYCGMLVEPKDYNIERETLVDSIWGALEKVNESVPATARMRREMIVVSVKERLFPRSSKGAPVRKLCFKLYEEEIRGCYGGL
ncbi:hypothetical protein HYALB_00012408 [Hymenoscyphus albidus]|uniref:AMP-dependent synthetase/ligase domain-containing protein n=1 Tax=Hymenoscyphus albidus TaxID=595503 RepID=A0A9N9LUQ6_9HELO|nr:hypothetical protein HYALB_00012408 [Hymenoscyphus albidus]